MRISNRQRAALIENNLESNRITREAIREALLQLMDSDDYAAIRITQIIIKSGVSRSAFYRNYKSKDEVLEDLIGAATEDYRLIAAAARQGDWENVLVIAKAHEHDIRLFIKAGLEHRLLDEFSKLLPPSPDNPYRSHALNGIVYATVIAWMRDGARSNIEQTAALIQKAVQEIAPAFG